MDIKLDKRTLAAAGVLAAVVVGGGASLAAASGSGPTSAGAGASVATSEPDGETEDGPDGGPGIQAEEQDLAFTGSVAAPAETEQADGQEGPGGEDAEQAILHDLAVLTPQEAEQAALAASPGTVAETDLDNENGYVVYSVEINGADGTVSEVVIDAGDGAVLAQQAEDADAPGEAADQPEVSGDRQD